MKFKEDKTKQNNFGSRNLSNDLWIEWDESNRKFWVQML